MVICGIITRVIDMEIEKELPKRKDLRLKHYDYGSAGAYFVTICVKNRERLLSEIIKPVGVGALDDPQKQTAQLVAVGVGALDDPQIKLTEIGKIIEKNLISSERIPGVKIDRYVIMPDHIHAIIIIDPDEHETQNGGPSGLAADRNPANKTLPHIISTFKRFCGKEIGCNVFQRGYYEHIVRNKEDYQAVSEYIFSNPARWCSDESHE